MDTPDPDINLITRTAGDALTVRRAFGEAYQQDGAVVIPVAKVLGGAGSGFGSGEMGGSAQQESHSGAGEGTGGGGGFGVRVRPLGVFVLTGDDVRWRPAIDLNRAILGGQLLALGAAIALAWALRRPRTRP